MIFDRTTSGSVSKSTAAYLMRLDTAAVALGVPAVTHQNYAASCARKLQACYKACERPKAFGDRKRTWQSGKRHLSFDRPALHTGEQTLFLGCASGDDRMLKLFVASTLFAFFTSQAIAQNENSWCDKNCVSLCQATAGKGYIGTVEQCIAQFSCPAYAGKPCAPASVVQNRANAANNRRR
jgi:hypothetical protein